MPGGLVNGETRWMTPAVRGPMALSSSCGSVRRAEPDLDQHAARHPEALVVAEAMRALDDELVAQAGDVGEPRDPGGIVAGDARGRLEHEASGGARRHQRRLRAQHARDGGAGRLVQLVDVDQRLRGLAHGLDRLGPHQRAAVAGGRPRPVDDATDAESGVDGGCRCGGVHVSFLSGQAGDAWMSAAFYLDC